MTDTDIIKLFGGPGTGKTTTMVGNTDIDGGYQGILHKMFDERDPDELMLIAYTRAAADEAKERLYKLTERNKGTLDKRITTIHSLVMGMNGLYPQKICEIRKFQGNNDYRAFCEEQDLEYSSNGGDDEEDILSVDDDEGHTFFKIHSWLKSNMMSLREWEECPAASGWPHGDDFVDYGLEWIQYKNREDVREFDDAIQMSVDNEHTVDADELFIDEAQDLYPLQQAFVDNQIGEVDRLWLAGDDDQTIYEWSGADPTYFLNIDTRVDGMDDTYWGDKEGYWEEDGVYILDQSWRMPSEVLDLSRHCIESVDERQDKSIKPHHDGGEITVYNHPDASQLANHINHDDTFILFRSNHQASNFGKELIQLGIPFEDRFKTWRDKTQNVRDGMAAMYDDERVMPSDAAAQIVRELPDGLLSNPRDRDAIAAEFEMQKTVDVSEVVDAADLPKPTRRRELNRWLVNDYENLNYYQIEAVKNNVLTDKTHLDPDGLTIETIHWSKGREADTVILSLDTTNTVLDQMPRDGMSDAERRLYYVGMSRTENELVIAQSTDHQTPSIQMDRLFGAEWRDKYEYADMSR